MKKKIKQIRVLLLFYMIALFVSGLTAMPAESELALLTRWFKPDTEIGAWLDRIYVGIKNTNDQYPFLAYGYDWLAFAHYVLAILFIGPYRDPVRNKWVIQFGIIACILILPFAFVVGPVRHIPLLWTFIDCSFGVAGVIPLYICLRLVEQVEILKANQTEDEN